MMADVSATRNLLRLAARLVDENALKNAASVLENVDADMSVAQRILDAILDDDEDDPTAREYVAGLLRSAAGTLEHLGGR